MGSGEDRIFSGPRQTHEEEQVRLLVANANTTHAITDRCADAARAVAAPGTEIVAATPRFGAQTIGTRVEDAIAGHALLELLAEHAGAVDGALLAVSHDTALEAARQLMPCPVVGMTEAACFAACMLGGRFGLVTFGGVETYRERIGRHGLAGRLAGLRGLALTPLDAVRDPVGTQVALAEGVAALVAEGADAVVFGGAALAGMAVALQPRAAVPLLDGVACGVKWLEGLVALRLPKPTVGSYARPSGRVVTGVGEALASRIG